MSLAAIITLGAALIHGLIFGFVRETDEGVAAHLWQLFMGGQVPVIVFFAIKHLPRNPKEALEVLTLQIAAALAACAPVAYFNL